MGRAREFSREFHRETIARTDRVFPEGGGHRRMRGKLDVRIGGLKPPDKLRLTEMSNIFDLESARARPPAKVLLFNLQPVSAPDYFRARNRGKWR